MNFERIYESVLSDNSIFYDFVKEELHDQKGIDITSEEPMGSNISCFSYDDSNNKDDSTENDEYSGNFHKWNNCRINMDDDGLYWESATGKKGCLSIYAITKAELKPRKITLWIAPLDSSEEMGVVTFYKN